MDKFIRLRTVDGFDISAVVSPGARKGIVIWMHGIMVNKDEYLGFFRDGAKVLGESGYTSVRFDFRGHGESSGSSMDFTIVGQNIDVRSVIGYVCEEYRGTTSHVHLIAASFGAPPAIFAAARYPELIRTVSLISPVLSYRRTFLHPETEWASELFTEEHLRTVDEGGKLYMDEDFCIGGRLVEEMRIARPDAALAELRQPVLVLHGNRDSMVPYDATVKACRGLRQVKLVTMDGVDHGFMTGGDEEGTDVKSINNKQSIYRHLVEHMR